jgi:FKBP-type peptidyl-prolyl cis-trans isomerase FkpA
MMRTQKRILTGIVIVAMWGLFSGCNNGADDPFDFEAQLEKEIKQIDDYLTANAIAAVEDPSGIRMVITKLGTGLPALSISTVDVDYKGTLFSDGSTFDEGNTRLTLTSYVPGWQIAFSKLPEGSEAKLYIPSYYGYANNARDGIPANSALVFDVKFKDIVYPSSYLQRLAADTTAIDQYLTTKGIIDDVVKKSQIRYIITTQGSGATPALYDKLKISYSIKLLTNDTQPVITLDREPGEFFFSRSIDYVQGMLIGLSKMPESSKATLYIPSGLAFGPDGGYSNGVMVVPPNANLIIEVELKEIL